MRVVGFWITDRQRDRVVCRDAECLHKRDRHRAKKSRTRAIILPDEARKLGLKCGICGGRLVPDVSPFGTIIR